MNKKYVVLVPICLVFCTVSYAQERYTINDNGTPNDPSDDTVTDNFTDCEWQRIDDNTQRNHANATSYCDNLVLQGGGWRLPFIKELTTLVDLLKATFPLIDESVFPDTESDLYWSSTLLRGGGFAWVVDFGDFFDPGLTQEESLSSLQFSRCVRRPLLGEP